MFFQHAITLAAIGLSSVAADKVGRLPALGWNSWNAYKCDVDENKILVAAQSLIALGLKDAGYEYVNVDDCWMTKDRDPVTGRMVPDPQRFSRGIGGPNGLAQQIHDMGLKFGLYSSAGTATCEGRAASLEKEDIDAETWAAWGVDYLKYDNCNIPKEWQDDCSICNLDESKEKNGTCKFKHTCKEGEYDQTKSFQRYRRMGEALRAQNRTMLYSLCNWGHAGVFDWAKDTFASSWRSTGDITPDWQRVKQIWSVQSFLMNHVDFGSRPDADMLEVGNKAFTDLAMIRSHFAMWALQKSPLILGTPLDQLDAATINIITNKWLLRFNQDPHMAKPAAPYRWQSVPDWTFDKRRPAQYWSGTFTDFHNATSVLVALHNSDDKKRQPQHADLTDIPELDAWRLYRVRDAWTDEDLGCVGTLMGMIDARSTGLLVYGERCDVFEWKGQKSKTWFALNAADYGREGWADAGLGEQRHGQKVVGGAVGEEHWEWSKEDEE